MKITTSAILLFSLLTHIYSQQKVMDPNIESRIDSIISQMTLEEKVGMIHGISSFGSGGVDRLGIRGFTMSDGPHGVRMEFGHDWKPDTGVNDSGTYLPVGVTLASTWNRKLGYAFGSVLGSEAKYRGKDIILGPGINILRTPLCGRNFEYLGEDPLLTGEMAVGYIKGVQDQGIAACVKHFAANNQEHERFTINVEMSERALQEIYLPAFKAAVQHGGVLSVMGAYNKFRGQYCSHNEYLLNTILKHEWGFNGILISDWNAVHDTKEALLYGCDIEMGTDLGMKEGVDFNKFYLADPALKMLRSGEVDSSVMDDKIRRILRVMYQINMFGERSPGAYNTKEHQMVARKVAEEGIVLLKNEQMLPLQMKKLKKIVVIGTNADTKFAKRGGSSQVKALYEVTLLEGLKNACGKNIEIVYEQGYEITREGKLNEFLFKKAVQAASQADVVIYGGGSFHGYSSTWRDNAYDAEGLDKPDMKLPFYQDSLLKELAKVNKNIIVALFGGGPVEMHQWIAQVPALLQVWYPGMEGGNAMADIIFGKVNPSGKLPMSFPVKLEDCPAHKLGEYPGSNGQVTYNDGIYVGYRYYETNKIETQFCFGFGLSYTTFSFSNIKAEKKENEIHLKFDITNTGKVAGAEVAQVYVHDVASAIDKPIKELKAFEKIFLNPGQKETVLITLNEEDFKYFDEKSGQWMLENGQYELIVSNCSKLIFLSTLIDL